MANDYGPSLTISKEVLRQGAYGRIAIREGHELFNGRSYLQYLLRLHVSVMIRCPPFVIRHPSKRWWCRSPCVRQHYPFSGCVGLQGGVHMLRDFNCTLHALYMARLSKLLQLEQEHVGWWRRYSSGVGGWYTEEEEATAQAEGPSYKSKTKRHGTYYHLVKDDLMKYGEKFREYFRLTRQQFDLVHHLFVLLGAVYTAESPEYWLRILGCMRP